MGGTEHSKNKVDKELSTLSWCSTCGTQIQAEEMWIASNKTLNKIIERCLSFTGIEMAKM